jgi:DNA repair exonuclease SbcCD ATPase subunit
MGETSMARISIGEAAKRGFKSRSQINKDVQKGTLPSFEERGRKVVDVADLIRRYGEPGSTNEPSAPIKAETAIVQQELEQANERISKLEAQLREARDTLKDKDGEAAKERDRLMSMVEDGQKRLVDLREDQKRVDDRQQQEVDRLRKELDETKQDLRTEMGKGVFKRLFGN